MTNYITQWVVDGDVSHLYNYSDPVTNVEGTNYPWNFPKEDIPNCQQVVAAVSPTGCNVHGFHVEMVDGVPTQTWESSPYTAEQLNAPTIAELAKLDVKSTRALRAVSTALATHQTPDETDVTMLAGYTTRATKLRAMLVE